MSRYFRGELGGILVVIAVMTTVFASGVLLGMNLATPSPPPSLPECPEPDPIENACMECMEEIRNDQ